MFPNFIYGKLFENVLANYNFQRDMFFSLKLILQISWRASAYRAQPRLKDTCPLSSVHSYPWSTQVHRGPPSHPWSTQSSTQSIHGPLSPENHHLSKIFYAPVFLRPAHRKWTHTEANLATSLRKTWTTNYIYVSRRKMKISLIKSFHLMTKLQKQFDNTLNSFYIIPPEFSC